VITQRAARAKVPVIITNHTYDSMDQYKPKAISGGSGVIYASSIVITLSKSKDKDGTEVVGNLIRATNHKNRKAKENSQVVMKLSYKSGLDKYYGLVEIAEKAGVFKKVSTKIQLPDGSTHFAKHIYNNPSKFFTPDVLAAIDEGAKLVFGYGEHDDEPEVIEEDELE
jgi:hypothetical protein